MAISAAHRFVHLRAHSAYSLLEGALTVERLAALAVADAMPALAITDTNNLFGALEFSEKLSGYGVQPIIGCTLAVEFGDSATPANGRPAPARVRGEIALLAATARGYDHLMLLSSQAYLDVPDGETPHVAVAAVADCNEGLICLTGGPDGPIDQALAAGQLELAEARLAELRKAFGDRLYIEVQRHGLAGETAVEPQLIDLAHRHEVALVASNEPYFEAVDDYQAHDALICVAEGSHVSADERRRLSPEHGFKSQAEMTRLFADLPEALENTLEIARRCAYRPRPRKPILPQFVATAAGAGAEAQEKAEAAELTRQAEDGLRARLAAQGLAPGMSEADYWDRLKFELSVINRMRYQGYFLIVADFIKWAKAQGIPVGPGRGSGAGSVVAWVLTITDLDPMQFGLLFERFLNPERVSMPDFDIDFCQDRRDEVIRYVQQKYGADRVAQIITYGRLQARAVLRDVGRVLQMPFGQIDRLCKLVPNNPAAPVTLKEAIDGEPRLQEARDQDAQVAQLFAIAQKLEGLNRNASTHAAGVVIGDRPLTELVPLYRDPRGTLPATQFNLKWVEAAGLVKFDFLGLKTLTVLQRAIAFLTRRGVLVDLAALPLDDRKSYELMSRGDTIGVFQLESTGMRDALRKLKPDRFEDIIAMVSLYRPGPMDNIPTYVKRKHKEEVPDYFHPRLEPILRETYGVIIYQEQVMQIAQVLSGYSLGQADMLRRAMGKKDKAGMAKQQEEFVAGAIRNGVEAKQAADIFVLVDKFAGYGFNKSHAAAYALIAYHTAWLKANHPVEFLAATMSLDIGNTDKLAMFADEARRLGLTVLQPSINASGVDFLPEQGAIRYSLAALKNIGAGAVAEIVAARDQGGPFRDLGDFARRIDARSLNRRGLETMTAAGAFDSLEPNRASVHASCETILAEAQRTAADAEAGQNDLFAGGGPAAAPQLQLQPAKPWPPMERLDFERDAVGFFLSGHPLDQYGAALKRLGVRRWIDLEAEMAKLSRGIRQAILAGVVVAKKERRSKAGNRFAFLACSDQTGTYEAVVFSEPLADADDLLEAGTPVLVHVEAERTEGETRLRAQLIQSLDQASKGLYRGLRLVASDKLVAADLLPILATPGKISSTSPGPGSGPGSGLGKVELWVQSTTTGSEAEFKLPGSYDISPTRIGELRAVPHMLAVQEL